MNVNDVIIKPVITEKATLVGEENKYVFKVHPDANKIMVKQAIKSIYNVDPVKINIINIRRKSKRIRFRYTGYQAGWKKAIVTLKDSDSINVFDIK